MYENDISKTEILKIDVFGYLSNKGSSLAYSLSFASFIAFVLSIRIGTNIKEIITATIVPNIKATPNPPNIGSDAKRVLAKIIATAVKNIGFALVAVATAIALLFSKFLSFIKELAKSISNKEFLELIPIRAINPIREVAVRKNVSVVNISIIQCPTITPMMLRNEPSKMIPLRV